MSFILLLTFCCTFIIKAQYPVEFTTRDAQTLSIPRSETNSTDDIARFIQANYTTGKEKLFAIYNWVTSNIKYDTDSMYVINLSSDPEKRITAALRRRKGVCENFVAIFNDIALRCNLSSYEINGYSKQYGTIDKTAHAWCAVHLDNNWFFCDPTWDVAYFGNTKYFMIDPDHFIESHMPFDPLWQLLNYPVSYSEYKEGNIHLNKRKPFLNFADSMNEYLQLNELQKLEASRNRLIEAGIVNDLIKTRLSYLQMEISIIYQEQNLNIYNAAVTDLNKAKTIYNNFIQYRNNRFIPIKPENEIKEILASIDILLSSVIKKINELDRSDANFQYNTGSLSQQLDVFKAKVQVQKDFLEHYFTITSSEREQLFYQ